MCTIAGNRGQLWTSTLSPHLLSPQLNFPDNRCVLKLLIRNRNVFWPSKEQQREIKGVGIPRKERRNAPKIKFSELCVLLFSQEKLTKCSQNPGLAHQFPATPRGQLNWTPALLQTVLNLLLILSKGSSRAYK